MSLLPERAARVRCERCQRPHSHCLCALIPQLQSRTRVLILQHPEESRHALNTARLAVLGLVNGELQVGEQFADLASWLADPAYQACLLFPGDDAQPLATVASSASERPLLLVVPDGTWRKARKLLYLNPCWLHCRGYVCRRGWSRAIACARRRWPAPCRPWRPSSWRWRRWKHRSLSRPCCNRSRR